MSPNSIPAATVGRRGFIKGAAFGLGALALGSPLLTACTGSGSTAVTSSSLAKLPTYIPAKVAPTDLKKSGVYTADTYLRFPTDTFKSVNRAVGTGKPVTAITVTYNTPPPSLDQNAYWQFMNKELNIDYKPTLVAPGDFQAKFATTMAGGDIPDVSAIPIFLGLPRIPELFNSVFEDLTEFLSGDAIKDYPNLASIDSETWKYCRINGKLAGVPASRFPTAPPLTVRKDIFDKMGVNYNVKDINEFKSMLKSVTDPKANRYALSAQVGELGTSWDQRFMAAVFGAPNNWRLESDGKLTRDIETKEFKDWLAFTAETWKAGYWHPDSPNQPAATLSSLFIAGNVLMTNNGFGAWVTTAAQNQATLSMDAVRPFGADGGKGAVFGNAPLFSISAIKKTNDKERVKELLRVMDYMCAPFGSKEYFNFTYGVEGKDYTQDNGVPKATKDGKSEMGVSFTRLGNGPQVLFSSTPSDDDLKREYDWMKRAEPVTITDPTFPYWYLTVNQKTSLEKAITAGITDIVTGRQPLNYIDDVAKTWRAGGGDDSRKLYQDAIAADKK